MEEGAPLWGGRVQPSGSDVGLEGVEDPFDPFDSFFSDCGISTLGRVGLWI